MPSVDIEMDMSNKIIIPRLFGVTNLNVSGIGNCNALCFPSLINSLQFPFWVSYRKFRQVKPWIMKTQILEPFLRTFVNQKFLFFSSSKCSMKAPHIQVTCFIIIWKSLHVHIITHYESSYYNASKNIQTKGFTCDVSL